MKKNIIVFICLINLLMPAILLARPSGNLPAGNPSPTSITDPLNLPKENGVQVLIGKIIKAVLGIVGSLSLVMFIYGGFTWMTSSGNNEAVAKGKNTLIWATLGLAVIFSAYAILRFVFTELGVA